MENFPAIGTDAWGEMNQRRGELIRKKLRGELTSEEQIEYERLQRGSLEALERAYSSMYKVTLRSDGLETNVKEEARQG